MSTAIAIFVKTPGLSRVKTRLAADIGHARAREFYALSLDAVQQTVQSVPVAAYWAVAEADGVHDPRWQDFNTLYTGTGCLGQRQYHIYQTLLATYDRVLLIGADAPHLSKTHLEAAITALESQDYVIGPAHDGGYYLLGGRRPIPMESWTAVPWSTSRTRAVLEDQLPAELIHLSWLSDVDHISDLALVHQEAGAAMTPAQMQCMQWIEAFLQE